MHQLGVNAVMQIDVIGRQVLTEIRHPAFDPHIQHVFTQNGVTEPSHRVWIGKINTATVELTKIHQRHIAIFIQRHVAQLFSNRIELAIFTQIRVHVGHECDALIAQRFDSLWQIRITLLMMLPIPVPKQAFAERGDA